MFWKTKERKAAEEALAKAAIQQQRSALLGKLVIVHETTQVQQRAELGFKYKVPVQTDSHIGKLRIWTDTSIVIEALNGGKLLGFKNDPTMLGGVGTPELLPAEALSL
jgi:hypothetical protein